MILSSDMEDSLATYNPVALSTFQNNTTAINWAGFFDLLIPSNSTRPRSNSTIVVQSPPYYKGLNELLLSPITTLQTVQEYLIIQFVLGKIPSLDSGSRAVLRQMNSKIGLGTSVESERWVDCVAYTSSNYPDSLGRYYVLKNFGGEAEREKVEKFITTIHDQWYHQLNDTVWLDEVTRAKAIQKVCLSLSKIYVILICMLTILYSTAQIKSNRKLLTVLFHLI